MAYTIYDLQNGGERRSARQLPRTMRATLRLLLAAGRRELITVSVLQLGTAVGFVAVVLLGRNVLSAILVPDPTWRDLAPDLVALTVVSAALGVAQAFSGRQRQLLSELTARHAQSRILDVGGAADLAAFDEPRFHDAIMRAQTAVARAPMVVQGTLGLVQAASGILGGLVALAALQPLLLPLAVLAFVPAVLLSGRRANAYYRFAYALTPRDRERSYLARLLTDREAAREVRAMGLPAHLRERHDRLYDQRVEELRAVTRRQLRWSLLAGLGGAAIVGCALTLLLALTIDGRVSVSEATAAGAALMLLGQRLTAAGDSVEALLESSMFIEDYLAFLASASPEHAPRVAAPAAGALPAPTGVAVADDVWFAYRSAPDRPVLRGVSVRIAPGEVVALVGANGSGKSTLAKLLAGLYAPDRGRASFGGQDLSGPAGASLREDVGIVFQDFLRYDLPARDNIALGRYERGDDVAGIRAAARRAGIDDRLIALPSGYDTQMGPAFVGGVDLSLGQWQKVALARLFFRDAPFVILDEPTASLDARSEHELFARIRELFAGRSVLLISHRFSTVRDADRIYVLDEGRVVESGDHDALMAREGMYAEMFALQAAAYGERRPAATSGRAV